TYFKLRGYYRYIFKFVTPILVREKINRSFFAYANFILCIAIVFFIVTDNLFGAGFLSLIIASLDVVGSLVAEDLGINNPKKDFRSSILNKYAEIIFYTSIVVFFLQVEHPIYAMFAYLGLIGSAMCGFIKNKEDGLIQRQERTLLLSLGMFSGCTGLLFPLSL
ncbi:MAG: hypothetical protein V1647_02140, partial [Pseudomonadota bacterium]